MPSWGKAFTDPFFVMVLVVLLTLSYARSRTRKDKRARRALTLALLVTAAVGAIGTDATARLLERTLRVERERGIPAVIVVAGGGSKPETLRTDTLERVAAAVDWWKLHRRATLIMSGAYTQPDGRTSTRTATLMRQEAIRRGVPPARVLIEARSRNTREHPIEALRVRGIDRSTRIGVVTSAVHMRRTRNEFRKHFDTVIAHPVIERYEPLHIGSFIPSTYALQDGTGAFHEWLGLAWYALRS